MCARMRESIKWAGKGAYFGALVLHEGRVQFSHTGQVIYVDSGVGLQITLS